MRLNGHQLQQVADALIEGFPSRPALAQMLAVGMTLNLNRIVGGGGLVQQVHELTVWAQSQGRIEELIAAACAAVPDNPALRKLAADVESWKTASSTSPEN